MFYFDNLNGKRILRSDMARGLNAFFTTREINENDLRQSFGYSLKPEQTHSGNVEIVDSRTVYPDTDGLIIHQPKTAVYLKFADCTPLIFYDKKNNVAAVSHAGWRGTAEKIGIKTVEKMQKNFGTEPRNIVALIGPAISMCCYEVNDDVKQLLLSTVKQKGGLSLGNFVDLKRINARQLEDIGVEHIDICKYCTSCNNDMFYSYRKENGTGKRHFAFAQLL